MGPLNKLHLLVYLWCIGYGGQIMMPYMCLDGLPEKKYRNKKQGKYPQEEFHLIFKLAILLKFNKSKKLS